MIIDKKPLLIWREHSNDTTIDLNFRLKPYNRLTFIKIAFSVFNFFISRTPNFSS